MSKHSYTRCWLHMIWGTLNREKLLPHDARIQVSKYLLDYTQKKQIYMKINFVNADHVHALIDLPTHLSLEEVFQLFKGSSSVWINRNNLIPGKFSWGRGYSGFSVSHSNVSKVVKYIADQEEHHRKKTFTEEFDLLVRKHQLNASKKD